MRTIINEFVQNLIFFNIIKWGSPNKVQEGVGKNPKRPVGESVYLALESEQTL